MLKLQERRRRRSHDPFEALCLQLDSVRDEGGFEAVALVDENGCLLASAGDSPICDEMAAFLPLVAKRARFDSPEVEARARAVARGVEVRRMDVAGTAVMLCARAPRAKSTTAPLARGISGCRRILGVEA